MRIVLDTNVLVAGLLSPFGPPGGVLQLLLAGKIRPCYDARVLWEYRQILARPKFGFDPERAEDLLSLLESMGMLVATTPWRLGLPDPSDAPFLEVAQAGSADYLITGNLRHFPKSKRRGMAVVSPAELLAEPGVKAL
ncbi:MAG: putative toxin-antitoxin system toxin component, PIN family [Planctomycetota bacterium]